MPRFVESDAEGRPLDGRRALMRTWAAGFSAHLTKPLDFATIEALFERFSSPRRTRNG